MGWVLLAGGLQRKDHHLIPGQVRVGLQPGQTVHFVSTLGGPE